MAAGRSCYASLDNILVALGVTSSVPAEMVCTLAEGFTGPYVMNVANSGIASMDEVEAAIAPPTQENNLRRSG